MVRGRYTPEDRELADIGNLTPTDGNFIVGDGSTWVAESGATARTSLGLGLKETHIDLIAVSTAQAF